MSYPIFIDANFIEENTDFAELVEELRIGFSSTNILTPPRHHHDFPNSKMGIDSTMLLMPAWQDGMDAGVKIVTVSPENHQLDLPSIQGSYLFLNAQTGQLKAIMEAKKLTSKRTAAASALASTYLSNVNTSSMLMIGTGALSSELIKAHAAVRPISSVYVWGRNFEKAKKVCKALQAENFQLQAVESIESIIDKVDLISAATLSKKPLVKGAYLTGGQHIDLVGSYKPDMREADDDSISTANVFADVKEMAMKESGDLCVPLAKGIIKEEDIQGDLFDLCEEKITGRNTPIEITLFKSVGHALEDLVAARYYYKKYLKINGLQ
ncbi:MAG: ornithine cyclodeaminase family protein [Bacteroidota bacterium]